MVALVIVSSQDNQVFIHLEAIALSPPGSGSANIAKSGIILPACCDTVPVQNSGVIMLLILKS